MRVPDRREHLLLPAGQQPGPAIGEVGEHREVPSTAISVSSRSPRDPSRKCSATVSPKKTPRPSGMWAMPRRARAAGRAARQILPVEADHARQRMHQARDRPQRGGLPGSVRPRRATTSPGSTCRSRSRSTGAPSYPAVNPSMASTGSTFTVHPPMRRVDRSRSERAGQRRRGRPRPHTGFPRISPGEPRPITLPDSTTTSAWRPAAPAPCRGPRAESGSRGRPLHEGGVPTDPIRAGRVRLRARRAAAARSCRQGSGDGHQLALTLGRSLGRASARSPSESHLEASSTASTLRTWLEKSP